jgi:choline monooxygenase
MQQTLSTIIGSYDPTRPLERAATIPSAWYVDPRVYDLERRCVFGGTWQAVARVDQVGAAGRFVTADLAGEPILVTRDREGRLRAFYNVCRHHAAAVATAECGTASVLRCPYHGWTYELDGRLKGAPEFDGVEAFDKSSNGLVPVAVDTWEHFVFVRLSPEGPTLTHFLGDLVPRISSLRRAPYVRFGLQLEGVRRQLPRRRLPRAAHPQGARQRFELRRVHHRER